MVTIKMNYLIYSSYYEVVITDIPKSLFVFIKFFKW